MAAVIRNLPSRQDVEKALATKSLAHFTRKGWNEIDPSAYVHGRHIDVVAEALEAVTRGEIRRLCINVPPRHMKSILTSVAWPAWTWAQPFTGRKAGGIKGETPLAGPHIRFLTTSYAQNLSVRDAVKARRLIVSPWYRKHWGNAFKLTTDQNQKTRYENNRGGYRIAGSVDGMITGEGGDIVSVDDPHNVREAESEAVRESTLRWWDEAMQSRLNDANIGAFVIIQQRVHERDLTGHVVERDGYHHVCLPARYESDHPHVSALDWRTKPGELLWKERMGDEALSSLERALGPYAAAGQLQQRPAPREGGFFEVDNIEIVDVAPAGGKNVRAWDLAASIKSQTRADPDYTAGALIRRIGDIWYIVDMVRFRANADRVRKRIKFIARQDGNRTMIRLPQDPGQAGKDQATQIVGMLAGYNAKARVVSGDKGVRAEPLAAQIGAGNVRLVRGPWNDELLDEMRMFPAGSHDDQIDALADAFNATVTHNIPGVKADGETRTRPGADVS